MDSVNNIDDDPVLLYEASWTHGKTRAGEATYISAPCEKTGESCLIAIVSSSLNKETREVVAQTICDSLAERFG